MRRFGSKVSVIERNDRLVHREDEDLTDALQSLFEDEGINIILNARIKKILGKSGKSVGIVVEQNGAEKALEGTHLLVAADECPLTLSPLHSARQQFLLTYPTCPISS